MRRSISRKRRSAAREQQEPLHRTLPRLLVEDNDMDSDLPPTSPMSPAARRQIRKQLFGLESDFPYDHAGSPAGDGYAECHSSQMNRSAQSSLDLQRALGVLQQLTKTSSPEELAVLQKALNESDIGVHGPSEPAIGSLERTLTRRKSMYKPGEATRPEMKIAVNKQSAQKLDSKRDGGGMTTSDAGTGLLAPVRPSLDRAVTPADLDRAYLGAYQLGSLRVINGLARSPAPQPAEIATQSRVSLVHGISPGYFDRARPVTSPVTDHAPTGVIDVVDKSQRPTSSHIVPQDAAMKETLQDGEDASPGSVSTSSSRSPASKPARLVGHRRHAHQRANTVDLTFDETVAIASQLLTPAELRTSTEDKPVEDVRHAAEDVAQVQYDPVDVYINDKVIIAHPERNATVPSQSSPGSDRSPALSRSSTTDTSSDYSPDGWDDSAYASKTSLPAVDTPIATELCRQDTVIVHVVPKCSADSISSVYTLDENTSTETIQATHIDHHQRISDNLAVLEQHANSSSSSLSTEPRAQSSELPFRPQAEPAESTQSLSTQATSPVGPRKLQKKQPVPNTAPTSKIMVQGRQHSISTLPELPDAVTSVHTNRLSEHPGMDHLEKTFKSVKHSHSRDSLASTILLMPMVPIRFPSPTPTEEIERRSSPASPKGRTSAPHAPERTRKGFFSSLSRFKDKKNEKNDEPQITVADLGDVVGVLGSSPYDAASSPKTSTPHSTPDRGFNRPLLHPHQISTRSPPKASGKGMTAEAATALAQLRSRDRTSQQRDGPKSSPSRITTRSTGPSVSDNACIMRTASPTRSTATNTVFRPALPTQGLRTKPPVLPSETQRARPKSVYAGLSSNHISKTPSTTTSAPQPSASAPPAPASPTSDWSSSTRIWRQHRQSLRSSLSADTNTTESASAPPPVPVHSPSSSSAATKAITPVPIPPAHTPRPRSGRPAGMRTPHRSPVEVDATTTTSSSSWSQDQHNFEPLSPSKAGGQEHGLHGLSTASSPSLLEAPAPVSAPAMAARPTLAETNRGLSTWSLDLDLGDAFVFDV